MGLKSLLGNDYFSAEETRKLIWLGLTVKIRQRFSIRTNVVVL